MSEDNICPFCGAAPTDRSENIGAVRAWECGTNFAIRTDYGDPYGSKPPEKKEYPFRSDRCYEAQITALQNLLVDRTTERDNAEVGFAAQAALLAACLDTLRRWEQLELSANFWSAAGQDCHLLMDTAALVKRLEKMKEGA